MRARVQTLTNVASLVSIIFAVACGGDKSGDRTDGSGGSGTTSSGGSSSTGMGGGTSASGGKSAGNGGTGGLTAFACDAKAVTLPDLTSTIDTSGKWGSSSNLNGGSFKYGDLDTTAATITYATNEVHIKGSITTYSGYGMWFGGIGSQMAPCADASKYDGLSFELVNNADTTPNLNVQVQVHDDSPVDTTNMRGGCVYSSEDKKYSDCVYPNTAVTIPTDGSAIQIPWSMFGGGKPIADAQGGAALDGLQWEFWKEGATAYDVDVTIKNIKFYGP